MSKVAAGCLLQTSLAPGKCCVLVTRVSHRGGVHMGGQGHLVDIILSQQCVEEVLGASAILKVIAPVPGPISADTFHKEHGVWTHLHMVQVQVT